MREDREKYPGRKISSVESLLAQPASGSDSLIQARITHPSSVFFVFLQTELEKEKSRKDGGDSAWIERTRRTEAELDWAKEMADRLDRVNQGLSRENLRLKSQFKSQEDDRKFLIKQLVAIKVRTGPRVRGLA